MVPNRIPATRGIMEMPPRQYSQGETMRRVMILAPFILFAPISSLAQAARATTPPNLTQSCRKFVQEFYDWYAPKVLEETAQGEGSLQLAFRERKEHFSQELIQALREDSEAEQKAGGLIVGIDFDPILNGQDIEDAYAAGNVSQRGKFYFVEVYGVSAGKKKSEPDLVPELQFRNGNWVFVNFHYGKRRGNSDLLTILKMLREQRERHGK
jgi:hypothetical protein